MKSIVHVQVIKSDDYFIARFPDLPIVTQGETIDDLMSNIREAVELYFDGTTPIEKDYVPHPSVLASFEIDMAYATS